jgi:hypothetical protein
VEHAAKSVGCMARAGEAEMAREHRRLRRP